MTREELIQLRDAIDLTLALPDSSASCWPSGSRQRLRSRPGTVRTLTRHTPSTEATPAS